MCLRALCPSEKSRSPPHLSFCHNLYEYVLGIYTAVRLISTFHFIPFTLSYLRTVRVIARARVIRMQRRRRRPTGRTVLFIPLRRWMSLWWLHIPLLARRRLGRASGTIVHGRSAVGVVHGRWRGHVGLHAIVLAWWSAHVTAWSRGPVGGVHGLGVGVAGVDAGEFSAGDEPLCERGMVMLASP